MRLTWGTAKSKEMSMGLVTADIETIQRIISHRYPFLLVDRVMDINGTISATESKCHV